MDDGITDATIDGPKTSGRTRRGPAWQAIGILAELLITMAAICALYIVWQMWWTGVQAERTQVETREQVSWSDPSASGDTTIAEAQSGDAPVQPESARYGDLIAQLYVPRFGEGWQRNIVEGTDAEQLARHGLGHYQSTQMPGEVGNFAIAGHRSGYGEPLGDIDKLQEGDPIIIRTQDYWYVYTYKRYQIVVPTDVWVIAPDPENLGADPSKRLITLTTCEPKYTTATHRWIAWGELKYWAKVSDGIPQELSTTDSSGKVKFASTSSTEMSLPARIGSLQPYVVGALTAWAVFAIAAAVAWRWPLLADIRAGRRRRPDASLYGGIWRLMPGILPIRVLLTALLVLAAVGALFQWAFPWASANIPMLQQMSNYVAVQQ
ncbi:class E sortase [Bifidobacterium sp. MA2]|uniref:Class E sortase n=1 Tax=Bifidobacterium santillanense TaxID=2809028 RepID=A0ABS5UP23_9BIFI|nr:class E sortase [Bifidobacterium santillanense]MBT1172662.1 class E sortase [Bifidobacterium santillanense]